MVGAISVMGAMAEIESCSSGELERYLKNIILEGRDEICSFYIELSARERLPITRRLFEEKVSLTHEFEISELVEKEKHLMIYGEAGSGKTITLKWLNAAFSMGYLEKKEGYIPIYASLDSYVKGSFYDYLKAKAKQKCISEPNFRKLLEGRALLLLDGLDLLTPADNFSPFDEISDFISEYEDCRYVITSRPGPFGSIKSTFALSELEKLSDEKIRYFIEKQVPNKRQAKLLKARSLNGIHSKSILRNPLLLTLWVKISIALMEMTEKTRNNPDFTPLEFISSDFVFSNRAELYRIYISELLRDLKMREDFFDSGNLLPSKINDENDKKTNSEKVIPKKINFEGEDLEREDLERADLENVLMNLSFIIQCRNRTSCKYSNALEVAEEYSRSTSGRVKARKLLHACFRHGLLTRKGSEVRFGIDRSFQEYFAALKLKTYFENGMDIAGAFRHPGWENVVLFTSELVESGEELAGSMISSGDLYLTSKCAMKASPETKEKLCTLLSRKLDSRYMVEKIKAIQSLGRLGACGIGANSGALEDEDIGVRREAVRVLRETKSEIALSFLEAALRDEDYSVRIEAVKALSTIGSEKAVELLSNTFEDKIRAVRLEATDALAQIGSEKALEVLVSALGAKDDFVRFGAIGALGRANSQKVAEALIKAFKEEDKLTRLGAAEALGQMKSEKAVGHFVDALADKDEFVRWIATKTLREIKSDKTYDTFINMLGDKSRFVRREAAKGLGVPGADITLEPLVSALSDEDEYVRKTAAESLGEIGSETAAKTLINKLNDKSHFVRLEAARSLGMIKVRKAATPLLFALGDENHFVRKEAANALGQLESGKVLEQLIYAFKSGDRLKRQGAVRALGQTNLDGISERISDRVFDFLDSALNDEDKFVRKEAAKALGNISESRSERAFESLINALDNEDSEVRRLAADSLEFFNSEEAVPQLINALKSEDAIVRRSAAKSLGQIGSKKALKPLIDVLNFDNDGCVREEAARALGKLKSKKAIEPLIDALMDENNEGRWGAAEALGRLKAENAVDNLIIALEDADEFTRLAAAKALGRIKSKKAIEPLISTLHDWNRFVKAEAAGALSEICTKEDGEQLKALLDSEYEFAANLAFEILERIKIKEILKTKLFLDLYDEKN